MAKLKTTSKPRLLTTVDALAMTVGTMVGAGIFAVLALTERTAGSAAILAWVLVVLLSLPMAYMFSDLTLTLSASGGPYVYLRDSASRWLGYTVALTFLLSAVGATEAVFIALTYMLHQSGVMHVYVWSAIILLGLCGVLAVGLQMGAMVQRILTSATVILLVLCVIVGITHFVSWRGAPTVLSHARGINNLQPTPSRFFSHGVWAVLPATFYAFWTYSGWEAIAVPSGAYVSRKALAKGMLIGSILVGLLYILVAVAATVSIPQTVFSNEANPLAAVGGLIGPIGSKIVSWGAVIIVISSMLSWLLASASLLQAVIRDGILPAPNFVRHFSGEFHPILLLCLFLVLLVMGRLPLFQSAVAVSSLTALVGYAVVFGAVAKNKSPDWVGVIATPARRRIVALVAFVVSVVLIVASGWVNMMTTGVFLLALGTLAWFRSRRTYHEITVQDL